MIEIIITVIIVLTILTGVMFLLLKKIVKDISNQSKEYFALKLQDYDELVEQREQKLLELEENKKEEKEEKKESKTKETVVQIPDKVVEYQIEDILQKAKEIDSKFSVDEESIINNFLKEKVTSSDDQLYQELVILKQKIIDYGIYNLLTKNVDIKHEFLDQASDGVKDALWYHLQAVKKIKITEFLEFLDLEIKKNDPTITIEVGEQGENYNHLSPYIQTVYNKKIYKGIKIYYQNRLYDYSLE
ncbi:MAG: hypothetical protein HFG40_00545 [Bacilli bacterium]|nr:hypothetical protein [Bacilli bacterium]